MDWKFVVALIFALIVAIFAIQNAGVVEVSFLTFELSMSMALVILISAVFGALVALMLSLIRWFRAKTKEKTHQKPLINWNKKINSLKQSLTSSYRKWKKPPSLMSKKLQVDIGYIDIDRYNAL